MPYQDVLFTTREPKEVHDDLLADSPIYYKSDADMSDDAIIQGMMEISVISLPDESHKYYKSSY